MLTRIRHSLAFRLPALYKGAYNLVQGSSKCLPEKSNWQLNMVLLCGEKNTEYLTQTLRSIYKNFSRLPHIFIFTDSHLTPTKCAAALSWFPSKSLTIISSSDCIQYHMDKGNSLVAQFAGLNTMGLKLAAILQIADQDLPVLYCDTDVLWFKNPYQIFKSISLQTTCSIHLSYDFQPAYDNNLIEKGELNHLKEAPFYCAGIMYINRLSSAQHKIIAKLLPIAIEYSNHFTEQTIFASIQKDAGISLLAREKFAIILHDKYKFKKQTDSQIVARHYVGPVRHLFWRDAISFFRL
jgi:hypothetical protein